jgi:hypothetical protein
LDRSVVLQFPGPGPPLSCETIASEALNVILIHPQILEFMGGGDLLNLLIEKDIFEEDFGKFYIAEVSFF